MQIAKSMLFLFLGGCCLKSSIRVRDREVDGLSVLMGMFIGNGIGRGISFSFVRIPSCVIAKWMVFGIFCEEWMKEMAQIQGDLRSLKLIGSGVG